MGRMIIQIRRLEREYRDEPVANLIAFKQGSNVKLQVQSTNKMIKKHLEEIITAPYHAVLPGPTGHVYYPNHAEFFYPGTASFLTFLHDRLSWYGYITEVINRKNVMKSVFYMADAFDEEDDEIVSKSVNWGGSMYTRTNADGDTILIKVPPRYIAVSKSGKVVGPGKFVGRNGVNLDKDNPEWSLQPAPGAGEDPSAGKKMPPGVQQAPDGTDAVMGDEEWSFLPNPDWSKKYATNPAEAAAESNAAIFAYMKAKKAGDKFLPPYHPGMHNKLYSGERTYNLNASMFPAEDLFAQGITMADVLQLGIAANTAQEAHAGTLPVEDTFVMMGTDKASGNTILAVGKEFLKLSNRSDDWAAFDASIYMEMTLPELVSSYNKAKSTGKIHPALMFAKSDNKFGSSIMITPKAKKSLNLEDAMPWKVAEENLDTINTPKSKNEKLAEDAKQAQTPKTHLNLAETGKMGDPKAIESDAQALIAPFVKESEAMLAARAESMNRLNKDYAASVLAVQKDRAALEEQYFKKNDKGFVVPKDPAKTITSVRETFNEGKGKHDLDLSHLGPGAGLMPHQIYGVELLTQDNHYAAYGGPEENDGVMLNWKPGLGKSFTILGADAVMRNKGRFTGTHIITAPTAVVGNWAEDLKQTRGMVKNKDFFVIEGTRKQRTVIWEKIRSLTDAGKPPSFVLIGNGKMLTEMKEKGMQEDESSLGQEDQGYVTTAEPETPEETADFAFDLDYLRDILVDSGNVSALTIDETGLYVNPDAKRHTVMRALVNMITAETDSDGNKKKQRGVIWTLNGNLMGNSAMDTIVEAGWVNALVRNRRDDFSTQLTTKPFKNSNRRAWKVLPGKGGKKTPAGLTDFMQYVGYAISRVDPVKAVGKNNRQINQKTLSTGAEFASVYNEAFDKFRTIAEAPKGSELSKLAGYRMGFMTMMISLSQNTVAPQRLIEYGLADSVFKKAQSILSKSEMDDLVEQVMKYTHEVCQGSPVGMLPRAKKKDMISVDDGGDGTNGFTAAERNTIWEKMISKEHRAVLDAITMGGGEKIMHNGQEHEGWKNPIVDFIKEQAEKQHSSAASPTNPLRMGFASQSRILVEALSRRLGKNKLFQTQTITGGMKPEELKKIQGVHGNKSLGDAVFTAVTSAGAYGINLPSQIGFALGVWNPARMQQMIARFHRDPRKPIIMYNLNTTGIGQAVKGLAGWKEMWADLSETADYGDEDAVLASFEKHIGAAEGANKDIFKSLLDKLIANPIQIG